MALKGSHVRAKRERGSYCAGQAGSCQATSRYERRTERRLPLLSTGDKNEMEKTQLCWVKHRRSRVENKGIVAGSCFAATPEGANPRVEFGRGQKRGHGRNSGGKSIENKG